MAGIFKRFTNIVFGGGDADDITSLSKKLEEFESENVKLYCKDPKLAALIGIYRKARATFQFNEKTKSFGVLVENIDDDEDAEIDEPELFLPLTKTFNWQIYSPETDQDKFT